MRAMAVRPPVTAAMIAEELNLSRTTVSAVLSGTAARHRISSSTARRVMATAQRLNYRPNAAARQLAGQRSNSVGVLVTSQLMIDLRLIALMEVLASARGIRFIVGHAAGSEVQVSNYLADFRARGVDGVFSFFHSHMADKGILRRLRDIPNIVFYEAPTEPDCAGRPRPHYVGPDFFQVGYMAARHLLDRGRRRIGLYFREMAFPYAGQRRQGLVVALREAGLSLEDDLVWLMTERTGRHWMDLPTRETADQAVEDLVKKGGVDAVIAANDLYGASLIAALRNRGYRVPDDVAVVGSDNQEFGAFVDPAITTVDLRLDEVARELVQMMFHLLDGQPLPEDSRGVVVQPAMVIRNSG